MFLPGGSADRRSSMRLVRTLRRLFFLLFLFRLLLDPAELPEDLLPLFPRLSAACELHCKDLVHNLVEFRPARHAQSFQFVCHSRKADAKWPPFAREGAFRGSGKHRSEHSFSSPQAPFAPPALPAQN